MKKQTGLWIDTARAVFVQLDEKDAKVNEILSDIENSIHHEGEGQKGSFMGSTHINNEKGIFERKKQQVDRYLDEVVDQLQGADEIYVFGPGEIKKHLEKRIKDHRTLSSSLLSVETSDSMTENQLVAKVKDFFKK